MVAMLAGVRVHGGTFQGSMGSSGATQWEGVSDRATFTHFGVLGTSPWKAQGQACLTLLLTQNC